MKKPLDNLIVTQAFGVNPQNYSQFGYKGHEGVDFKTRWLSPSVSLWNDFKGWRPVYAVRDGRVEVFYDQGFYGTHIYLTDNQGNNYLYAHLKNARCATGQLVFAGQIIAVSDSTGNANGPHLHFGYKPKGYDPNNGYGGFVDPMPLFNPIQIAQNPMQLPLQVARIGLNLPPGDSFLQSVANFSSGKIPCVLKDYPLNIPVGKLSQDQAYMIADQVNPSEKFIFIFYQGAVDSVFFSTFYYPARNCVITACPGNDSRLLTFEFAHQITVAYNNHRGSNPYIEDTDSLYPSDDFIRQKYDLVSKFYQ